MQPGQFSLPFIGGPPAALIAVTPERVFVADREDFRKNGFIARTKSNDDIRYVRYREGAKEIDLITKDENLSFGAWEGTSSQKAVEVLSAILSARMGVPDAERRPLPELGSA